jgi:hypothetical protein
MKLTALKIGLVGIFAFAIFLVSTRLVSVIQTGGHNWAVGEWFINYGGGFVRRGLTGQLLLSLPFSRTIVLIILFLSIFSIVICVYLSVLISSLKSGLNFFSIFLLLNPAGMLFIAWDQNVFIRKEWLGLGILVLLSANTFKYKSLSIDLLVIALFILALMSSEVNAVYIPAIMYLLSHPERSLTHVKMFPLNKLFFTLSTITLIPLLIYHGDMKTSFLVCEKVKSSGFDPMLNCQGAIGTLGYSLAQALEHFKSDYPSYILYLPLALLGLLPICLTSWFKSHLPLVKQTILITLPLFLVAWDYGRWISIVVSQLTVLILMEVNLAKRRESLSTIVLPFKLKLMLLTSCCFWGLGHGGNPLTNGWIGLLPSLGRFLIG